MGVTFDGPNITWKKHVDRLVEKYTSFVSVMKSLSNYSWGSDRKTLLSFYLLLIRGRLDYCGFVKKQIRLLWYCGYKQIRLYCGGGARQLINKLDKLQN